MTLPLSPALRALLMQLDGFILLMKDEKFKKAAILYRRIQENLEAFDPRFYLPSLFGPYYAQLARRGSRLTEQLDDAPNFETEALARLCQVDLELFLKTEIEE